MIAPLPVSRTASALAFFAFVRAFAQTWGITISSTVLQNKLKKKLPASFTAQFPRGLEIAFAAIPLINDLEEPLRSEVRTAFADSMRTIWYVMIGISGAGLLSVALLKEVPMKDMTDERYALEERAKIEDAEGAERTIVDGESRAPGFVQSQGALILEAEEGLRQ